MFFFFCINYFIIFKQNIRRDIAGALIVLYARRCHSVGSTAKRKHNRDKCRSSNFFDGRSQRIMPRITYNRLKVTRFEKKKILITIYTIRFIPVQGETTIIFPSIRIVSSKAVFRLLPPLGITVLPPRPSSKKKKLRLKPSIVFL